MPRRTPSVPPVAPDGTTRGDHLRYWPETVDIAPPPVEPPLEAIVPPPVERRNRRTRTRRPSVPSS